MAGRPAVVIVAAPEEAAELVRYLERRGYLVRGAAEDWEARAVLSQATPDIAVVDLDVAPGWGLDLMRLDGMQQVDFIMAGSGKGTIDKVLALELGAADFVDKPFVAREIATRIGGVLSRRGKGTPELASFERSTADLRSALVMHNSGAEEQLSAGQIALLRLFLRNPRKVLGRDEIMEAAPAESWDAFDRSIDSRIVRLRKKLDTESIVTVRGAGYRYDPPQTDNG